MVMEKRNRQQSRQQCLSRFVGEVVEVSGGHIVRSTGRKDRHSKVYTAKGLRDRRLRLSAQTAIQFYDVQDRLGYDRPSKAVDWLMQNAKAAIDQLADLPSGHAPGDQCPAPEQPIDTKTTASTGYGFDTGGDNGGFFSASLESEAMEDSMKPFPRLTAYTPDLLFNPGDRTRDLRLSLQSFHEPISLHQNPDSTERSFCPGATNIAQCAAAGNKERMVWWNATNSCDGGGGDFAYNAAAPPAPQLVNSQFQLCTQREPLQSSNLPSSLRAWTSATALAAAQAFTPESYYGGFSGFNIPAQIQGEEDQNRISDNLRSATPE